VGRMDYMAHGHGKAAMPRPPEASPVLSALADHGLFGNSEIPQDEKPTWSSTGGLCVLDSPQRDRP
jgi:hypothetical protein